MRLFLLLGLLSSLVFTFFCCSWEDVLGVLFFLAFTLLALLGLLYRSPIQRYVTTLDEDD